MLLKNRTTFSDTPKVCIIILNWNGWRDTIECLSTLMDVDYERYQIVVLDNGSLDGSVERIREWLITRGKQLFEVAQNESEPVNDDAITDSDNLVIIRCLYNYGFAEGNNIAIRFSLKSLQPDYFLLLNNDTIVEQSFLGELVKAAEKSDMTAFCGPKVYYYDYLGRRDVIDFAGGRLNMWLGKAYNLGSRALDNENCVYQQLRIVDFVQGSCILVKAKLLQNIGLLDTQFFAYWEECDWCLRAKKQGYSSIYVPSSHIWHKIARSNSSFGNIYYATRNRFLFMKKHGTRAENATFLIYFWSLNFWQQIAVLVRTASVKKLHSFLRGVIDGHKIYFSARHQAMG